MVWWATVVGDTFGIPSEVSSRAEADPIGALSALSEENEYPSEL